MAKIRCFSDIQEGKNDILFVKGVRLHKKNSWLASLAFAKKWAGGCFFFKFLLIFNALVLGPKLDFLAQYRYFFICFKI